MLVNFPLNQIDFQLFKKWNFLCLDFFFCFFFFCQRKCRISIRFCCDCRHSPVFSIVPQRCRELMIGPPQSSRFPPHGWRVSTNLFCALKPSKQQSLAEAQLSSAFKLSHECWMFAQSVLYLFVFGLYTCHYVFFIIWRQNVPSKTKLYKQIESISIAQILGFFNLYGFHSFIVKISAGDDFLYQSFILTLLKKKHI